MKTILLFAFVLLLVPFGSRAQEGLLLRNNRTGKAWMYEKNARITYLLHNEDEYRTDVLKALLDSAVVFGKDTVPLNRIAALQKKNSLHKVARVAGLPLMLIGSLFMGQGAAGIYANSDKTGGIQFFLLGAGIFSLGYIPYEMSMEDLMVGKKNGRWSLEIYRGEPK